jgi:hypothetical protein
MPAPHARNRLTATLLVVGTLLLGAASIVLVSHAAEKTAASASPTAAKITDADRARSIEAFKQVASVLRHPRCINCHPAGDFPRQGNEGKRHAMLVVRGPDDHGAPAMKCSSCHQAVNQQNGIPGAPHWGLAPKSMGWEGLTDHELAEALKDPAKNGKRSLEQIFEHNVHDELVGWAWNPGAGRDTPPLTREEFAQALRTWIDTGALSPDPAKK